MKVFASFKYEAEYKVSGGIDRVEFKAVQLVNDILKNKFDHTVKMSEVKKKVNRDDNTSVITIAGINIVFVDGIITEVNPANSPEAKEIIKALKSQSKIANQL